MTNKLSKDLGKEFKDYFESENRHYILITDWCWAWIKNKLDLQERKYKSRLDNQKREISQKIHEREINITISSTKKDAPDFYDGYLRAIEDIKHDIEEIK